MKIRELLEANFPTEIEKQYRLMSTDEKPDEDSVIGQGTHAKVATVDDGNAVARVAKEYKPNTSEVFYELFVNWLVSHPDYRNNESFPRFFKISEFQGKYGKEVKYEMERLVPIFSESNERTIQVEVDFQIILSASKKLTGVTEEQVELILNKSIKHEGLEEKITVDDVINGSFESSKEVALVLRRLANNLISSPVALAAEAGSPVNAANGIKIIDPSMIQAVSMLKEFEEYAQKKAGIKPKLDLHSQNMMLRLGKAAPTVVITDPYW